MQTASTSTPSDMPPPNAGAKPPVPAQAASATEKHPEARKELPTEPTKESVSTRKLVWLLLATQQASIAQSHADREAAMAKQLPSTDCIARLEDALLLMTVKQETHDGPSQPTDRV
ncbi:hypothetical protein PGT21_029396 [Puccinia graminis f. sp. tritici]|uniref:Uncharacterized protein n=1 Tax=Puccinia graminis f. sp. tritici TaxID=56615 RepID=A0A5B0RSM2_PUCGR|nr:hypothetical protein PGT21_029396 [Puccinia graminis f. sp. tritici]KAA1128302.1 hypothetical protein PGTUg99_003040 [Puccinia graminis f. sp. tritici]